MSRIEEIRKKFFRLVDLDYIFDMYQSDLKNGITQQNVNFKAYYESCKELGWMII